MSNRQIAIHVLLRDPNSEDFLTAIIPEKSPYVLHTYLELSDYIAAAKSETGRGVFVYELPDELEIPDPVLKEYANVASDHPMICISSEDMPITSDAYDLLLEFISRAELTQSAFLSTVRNLLARYDASFSLKQSRTQLHIAKQELNAADVGAGIAHDANNMLSATIGHLQLLHSLSSKVLDSSATEHLNAALASCKHISYLLHEWKNSKKESGTTEKRSEPFALKKTIQELEMIVQPLIPEHINFSVNVSEDGYLQGRQHQIEQVLLNFILNAVQATPYQGKVSLSLNYLSEEGVPVAEIKISDTGEGIPEAKLTQIFNPFYSSKKKSGGSGLGLAMAHKIIDSHNGRITVESQLGEGTTFTILLPLLSAQSLSVVNSSKAKNECSGASKVLVIDDTASLLSIMEDFLEEYGMSAQTFADPRNAFEWSNEHSDQIDFIILDLQLPNISGKDCFYKYKEMLPEVPIVVYSGMRNSEVDELLENGALRFFEKPLDYDETVAWIKETIQNKKPS